MNHKTIPQIPKDLLEYLEKQFPDKLNVNLSESLDNFRVRQGQVTVVAHLRAVFNQQNSKVLKGDP